MYKEKIDAYIDSKKEEMLSDLEQLIAINSQKGEPLPGKPFGEGPAEAIAAAEALMNRYGLKTTNYENYVVTGDFSEQEKGLDVLAHLDVVPVTDTWTVTEPFVMKIQDGRIYGRGSSDDKGPAIAALYAIRAIKELNIPLKKNVRLILGSDEECGSSDLVYYYKKESEAPCTFTPDAEFPLINIEKGRLEAHFHAQFSDTVQLPCVLSLRSGDKANVVPQKAQIFIAGLEGGILNQKTAELSEELAVDFAVSELKESSLESPVKGSVEKLCSEGVPIYKVDVMGKAAHASTPQEGKNALTAALRLISRLPLADTEQTRALRALDVLFPYEDVCGKSLGIYREEAQSGAVTLCFSILNCTIEGLQGVFDARLPIGCDEENTKKPVAEALAAKGITMEDVPMIRPHCVPGDSQFVKTLLGSYQRYTGETGQPMSTGGGTYVHELERGVAFGCAMPGVDNHMHGDDEFMELDVLLMSAKIFADSIIKICG